MAIISKSPYRISLLGGSSDLDWYVNQKGQGICLGFSIKLYSRVLIASKGSGDIGILNYSSREEYKDIESISHPIIRSSLKRFLINKKIELCSIGEILSGSGLGSSSSFSVALIKSISELENLKMDNHEIAHIASEIEISDLGNPIGRQDQYFSALGGINILEFKPKGIVRNLNYPKIVEAVESFSNNLYLINTSIRRNANEKLSNLRNDDQSKVLIDKVLNITRQFLDKSRSLNKLEILELLEQSMKNAWKVKKQMNSVMNKELVDIENKILKTDFSLLKLLGAGGGGYFLVAYKGQNIEKDKSFLEENKLTLEKVEICNEGCISCVF